MRSAIFLVLAACRMGTLSPEEFDRQYPVGRLTTLSQTGMEESLEALREAVDGRVRITSLTFADARTTFIAQNPRVPSNFDSYAFWQGDVTSSAVTLDGDAEKRYIARLFDLESVPFDKLRGFALRAIKELPIEGARVQSVDVALEDGTLHIDIRLTSERRSGRVELDAQGTVLYAKPN